MHNNNSSRFGKLIGARRGGRALGCSSWVFFLQQQRHAVITIPGARPQAPPRPAPPARFAEIYFNRGHHICGALIHTYLLEKSRVAHQQPGERSYHVFYQVTLAFRAEIGCAACGLHVCLFFA